jgi:dephospho-CoA kinase
MAIKLGLTGGIGSGKSTAAKALQKTGAALLDADAVSRSATAPGGIAIAAIALQLGSAYIDAAGGLDRNAMRALIFSHPDAKKQLEAIVHPLVAHELETQSQAAMKAGCPLLVFDIPLLVESSRWRSQLDFVLVLDCLPHTQIQRVIERSGWNQTQVEQVMQTQASRAFRLRAADGIIYNEGIDIDTLEDQVNQYARSLTL